MAVYYFLLQPYAVGVGLPLASLGVVVVGVQVTTVAASWVAHRAESLQLTTLVGVGGALIVAATAALGALPSIPSLAFVLVVALVPALVGPLLLARVNDAIPSGQRATILSLSALLSELGIAAAVPLLLTAADVLDPPSAMVVSAAVFAIAFVPLWLVWRAEASRATGR